jgi:hypothetical protein
VQHVGHRARWVQPINHHSCDSLSPKLPMIRRRHQYEPATLALKSKAMSHRAKRRFEKISPLRLNFSPNSSSTNHLFPPKRADNIANRQNGAPSRSLLPLLQEQGKILNLARDMDFFLGRQSIWWTFFRSRTVICDVGCGGIPRERGSLIDLSAML